MPKMMATIQMSRERWKWQLPSRPRSAAAAAMPPGRAVSGGRAAAAKAGLGEAGPGRARRAEAVASPRAGRALPSGPGGERPGTDV